jgi:hypothetical protein
MPSTMGFINARQLRLHHAEHGVDFGAITADQYEGMADKFLGNPKPPHVYECTRSRGDVIRFDPHSQEYGVLDKNGIIRTYFKPIPCISLPVSERKQMKQTGRCHAHPTNLAYFHEECKKW